MRKLALAMLLLVALGGMARAGEVPPITPDQSKFLTFQADGDDPKGAMDAALEQAVGFARGKLFTILAFSTALAPGRGCNFTAVVTLRFTIGPRPPVGINLLLEPGSAGK